MALRPSVEILIDDIQSKNNHETQMVTDNVTKWTLATILILQTFLSF